MTLAVYKRENCYAEVEMDSTRGWVGALPALVTICRVFEMCFSHSQNTDQEYFLHDKFMIIHLRG